MDEWKVARDATIEWGKLRNHRKTTQRNDRKLPLWVAGKRSRVPDVN